MAILLNLVKNLSPTMRVLPIIYGDLYLNSPKLLEAFSTYLPDFFHECVFLKSRIFLITTHASPKSRMFSEVQNIFNTSIHNYTCLSEVQNIFLKSRIFVIPHYITTHAFLKSRIFF